MSLSLSTITRIPPKKKTLIVCDVQPDVVNKLQQPRKFVDLVSIAVQAARQADVNIVHTMLKFEPGYAQVLPSHPRLGILRRLGAKNSALKWFTSSELSTQSAGTPLSESENEVVVTRSTFLPHANDTKLMDILRKCIGESTDDLDCTHHQFTVVGYGPTVQAMCNLLGDILAMPKVQVLRECVGAESEDRRQALLEHGLLFGEEVVSLVDFLEATDLLHETIDLDHATTQQTKYVCDCDRGGHLSLFMPYLLRDHGYIEWPTQPWYQEIKSLSSKKYNCPLGRRMVDLCDEPKFSRCVRFFLAGRQHLDEKDLLHQLVPDFMPPTFQSIEAAQAYAGAEQTNNTKLLWFIKAVNQNGGRAVRVTRDLPTEPLAADEQLQVHVPRPLLYEQQQRKCHVKTYQYLSSTSSSTDDPSAVVWQVYMHDLFYLATASRSWSTDDLSDEAQITTMRTHRLYPDNPWRVQWNLTEIVREKMQILIERAIEQGKLRVEEQKQQQGSPAVQFEVNSADWMLDEDGRVYLIECNGIPVLYDAGSNPPQALVTKGLNLYDKLYNQDPETAVVNDHDLIKEALGLALTGTLPKASLWKHLASIPAVVQKE